LDRGQREGHSCESMIRFGELLGPLQPPQHFRPFVSSREETLRGIPLTTMSDGARQH
jgi:hypothetical protein